MTFATVPAAEVALVAAVWLIFAAGLTLAAVFGPRSPYRRHRSSSTPRSRFERAR